MKKKNSTKNNRKKNNSINDLCFSAGTQVLALKLSLQNMELFYNILFYQMRDNCPEVIVVEQNPNGEEIRWEKKGDREIAYLSQDVPDRQKLQLLMAGPPSKDLHHSAKTGVARSFSDSSDLYGIMAAISKYLSIHCPQLVVVDSRFMGNINGIFLIAEDFPTAVLIKDTLSFERKIRTIAHEMRHVWQRITNPEYFFADYHFSPDNGVDEYAQQIAEVDAEAFSRAFCHLVFGTPIQINCYSAYTEQLINELAEKMAASPIDYGISIPGVSGGQRRPVVA